MKLNNGCIDTARFVASPNHDNRTAEHPIELLVIHNISLPPQCYGGPGVEQLFTNSLNPEEHPYYAEIAHLRVSSHFFIRRDGELVQFVNTEQRAWHAGVSVWNGQERCNDFSIGIELEGSDFETFTDAQYECLQQLVVVLAAAYPLKALAGHSDIAPGRKTDPGPFFDWTRLATCGVPIIHSPLSNSSCCKTG